MQSASAKPPITGSPLAAAPVPEPPPAPVAAAPAGGSASAFNPAISLILNGSYANLSRDPSLYRLQGFIPSGGEVGPGERSFSLGESELAVGQHRSDLLGPPDRSDHVRRQRRGRGGADRTPGPVRRRDAARRPLPVVDRLPELPACACLGLLRCAAGLPGVLRRSDADRRDPARGWRRPSAFRTRVEAGAGAFPGKPATASAPAALFRTPRRRHRRQRELAGRAVVRADRAAATEPTTTSNAGRRVTNAFSGTAAPGSSTRSTSGRPVATRRRRTSSCRASTSGAPSAARWSRTSRRVTGGGSGELSLGQSGWYCRPSTSSCRSGGPACVTTGSTRAARTSAWCRRARSSAADFSSCRAPEPSRAPRWSTTRCPSSAGFACSSPRTAAIRQSPIGRSTCNTS